MRLVTWNCRIGGYRKKSSAIAALRPDVVVAQEVEPLSSLTGEPQPTCKFRKFEPSSPKRGVGVFGFGDVTIEPVDLADPMAFGRYRVVACDVEFQLVGVWTGATKSLKTKYRQAHVGIERNEEWIRQRPTVILGDFNNSSVFRYYGWRRLAELMHSVGLVSVYHHVFGEDFGKETKATHFHGGKVSKPFHLDYCFVPESWLRRVRSVKVGEFEDWKAHSDHVPIIVDIEL